LTDYTLATTSREYINRKGMYVVEREKVDKTLTIVMEEELGSRGNQDWHGSERVKSSSPWWVI
jgi:hypothetical protein